MRLHGFAAWTRHRCTRTTGVTLAVQTVVSPWENLSMKATLLLWYIILLFVNAGGGKDQAACSAKFQERIAKTSYTNFWWIHCCAWTAKACYSTSGSTVIYRDRYVSDNEDDVRRQDCHCHLTDFQNLPWQGTNFFVCGFDSLFICLINFYSILFKLMFWSWPCRTFIP